jgi:nucleotide-binding universal stress UspA family protein
MVKTILVAVDGSEPSRKAVKLAAQLAKNTGAKLIIATVISDRPLTPAELGASPEASLHPALVAPAFASLPGEAYTLERPAGSRGSDSVRVAADRLLTGATFEARQAGASQVETLVESGDPAGKILGVVTSRAPDLVVVGSRGLGGRAGRLLGGVSEEVILKAPCPVLVVKPSEDEE